MKKNDDVVYYKVKLQKLFQQAYESGIEIELSHKEVSFINHQTVERASARPVEDEEY